MGARSGKHGSWRGTSVGLLLGAGVFGLLPAPVSATTPVPATFLVGTAAIDITPRAWPVHAAAYGIHTASKVQAGRRFMARSIAVSAADGLMAHTVVLTVLDSQGYFIAYKEDPITDPGYFGTAGIRKKVMTDTGLDVEHVIIAATHTHNSPDSVGVWGGGQDANNEAYLQVVRDGAIQSIETALTNRQKARLSVGMVDARQYQDTLQEVRGDPATYPIDRLLRVLQARDNSGNVIATLVNYGDHGTVLGQLVDTISPDWPGEVAYQLDARWGRGTTIVVPGAVGRTWPNFPDQPKGTPWQTYLATFGRLVVGKVDAALARARPVVDGTVSGAGVQFLEPITDPVGPVLLDTKFCYPMTGVCGTMRSLAPPYLIGPAVIGTDLNALRVGDLFIGGAPAEAYPEISTELQSRVLAAAVCGENRHVLALSLANDQIGYTPTADEYGVAVQYGSDEGLFSLNPVIGNDVINKQLANARTLGFATGPDYTQVQPIQPPPENNSPAPPFRDMSGPVPNCGVAGASTSASPQPTLGDSDRSSLPLTSAANPFVGVLALLILLVIAAAGSVARASGRADPGEG
ncbi:MAG: hypothetical protein ACR2MY_10080 [Candidatus Dormibacteria bacterium]